MTGSRQSRRSRSRTPTHRRRRSSSQDTDPRHKRSYSEERSLRRHERSPTLSLTPSRQFTTPRKDQAPGVSEPRRNQEVKEEQSHLTAAAVDRRTRRHKQAARAEEMAQREREGKKPFYITLDAEGTPYGIGRPAWVSEVRVLAAGLDPSCTRVSKQPYELVTTLKARLNEKFEYSGTLNEAHLRTIMGRAVTHKRAELFALIRSGGSQPLHIDREVWERLLRLERSKQQKEKSEQGRRANAARKTYGRTGSTGVTGVRERLREKFNRSPDPDEMEDEMTRDKGYGGYKIKYIWKQ